VYYKAKKLATENGRPYHLAAILRRRGKVIKIGANTSKTHPRFGRVYEDGTKKYHMHAEMNVLRFAQAGDTLEVMRFHKTGLAMAKPCHLCMGHIKNSGIKHVRYTTERGTWKEIRI